MALTTVRAARNEFYVDAIRVTKSNMAEVAEWCGGEEIGTGNNRYIKIKVEAARNERQTKAFVGDWVLKAEDKSFKIYMHKAWLGGFRIIEEKPCGDTEFTADNKPCILGEGHKHVTPPFSCRSFQDYKAVNPITRPMPKAPSK